VADHWRQCHGGYEYGTIQLFIRGLDPQGRRTTCQSQQCKGGCMDHQRPQKVCTFLFLWRSTIADTSSIDIDGSFQGTIMGTTTVMSTDTTTYVSRRYWGLNGNNVRKSPYQFLEFPINNPPQIRWNSRILRLPGSLSSLRIFKPKALKRHLLLVVLFLKELFVSLDHLLVDEGPLHSFSRQVQHFLVTGTVLHLSKFLFPITFLQGVQTELAWLDLEYVSCLF